MMAIGKGNRTAIATKRKARRGEIFQRRLISHASFGRFASMRWAMLN